MRRLFLLLLIMFASMQIHAGEVVIKDQEKLVMAALIVEKKSNLKTAYSTWSSLADQGDYKAAMTAGLIHHQGRGMPVDFVKVMDCFLKALQHNHRRHE